MILIRMMIVTFRSKFRKIKNDHTLSVSVTGNHDPGYAGTAQMLVESALCIILNRDQLPDRIGVLTPAAALGDILIRRLAGKGIEFKRHE